MQQPELIPHLFRTEFSRISAVLCKHFGIEHIELAEDIASETFLLAMETWSYKGIPENPTAWLYVVAKNKAKNYFARAHMFREKIMPELKQTTDVPAIELDLSDQNISDSLLQMLFAICHPAIPTEAQIGLALRILCGFGIDEIAHAFLSNKETINKRLFRAREKLRAEKVPIEMPETAEIPQRLNAVLTTLYLLYNEGYYSESQDAVIREELCIEAIRLTKLLLNNPLTNTPAANALMALMCLHASRLPARKDENGALILYQDQDESLWNKELISEGAYHLHIASQGRTLSRYHLEATIAWWHTIKEDTAEKWDNILQLYNRLLQLEYSPVAALNRTFALSKVKGNAAALPEAEKLGLAGNPYYHTLLGELYQGIDNQQALQHLQQALHLSKTQPEKQTIQQKIDHLPIT
ncbi:RNA polymerase subunit sigma [Chitinophaga varians]|nr:RNA polymerase subunit sigma [Chitinophaga varians]